MSLRYILLSVLTIEFVNARIVFETITTAYSLSQLVLVMWVLVNHYHITAKTLSLFEELVMKSPKTQNRLRSNLVHRFH